jgi:thiopeptide-type bacteriocin biosynthesis protein
VVSARDDDGPAFAASGFFAMRTPLLAFDALAALAADRDGLGAIARRREVREAIYLASPSLDAALAIGTPLPASAVRAVFRYVARMAGRATPFGLFAGVSVGRVATDTDLRLGPRTAARKAVRLDAAYAAALARALGLAAPSVTDDDALADVIAALGDRDGRAELEAAARAIATLAAEPLGSDPAAWRAVARGLADLPERLDHAAVFATVARGEAATDPRGRVLARVARADVQLAHTLARGIEARAADERLAHVVQVDLIKDSPAATLGGAVIDELFRGAELLRRITPAPDPLAAFTAAFAARHGDESVPLLDVVDEDHGLPVPPATGPAVRAPLLRDLDFAGDDPIPPFGPRDAHLLERLQATVRAGEITLALDEDDLARLATDERRPLPDAFAVHAAIAAESAPALAAGRFHVHLASVVGPSGATLLGRFCHADPSLAAHVAAHLRAEEALRPDAIFAEISYLPEGRDGNVTRRPPLRAHQIAVGGAARDGQIAPADLRLSLVDGHLVLGSHRLGREVVPRLMSAHNYQDPRHPALYRLLGALQHAGTTGPLTFSWGALARAPFLPRVTAGRLVLARARWRIRRAQLAAPDPLPRLRDQLGLPRWVCLADHDRELPLDLDHPLAVDELITHARAHDLVELVEMFPPPDALVAHGPDGRYVHELVVPFVRRAAPPARAAPPPLPRDLPRRMPPGSAWLYGKLYTSPAFADELLRTVVAPIATNGAVHHWFFLRYADPDFHLRLRFRGDPDALLATVLPSLRAATAPAFAAGRITRWQLDTYERELDRYGGADGIELAERIFHADSVAALAWIADHASPADDPARGHFALRGIDQLLDDLGLALADKHRLVTTGRDDLQRRLRADAPLRRALGARFRAERLTLERALDRREAILDRRSAALRPIVDELRDRERAGRLTRSIADQARSHVHMVVNRIVAAQPVEHELVLYDFLARLYRGRLARGA